MGKFRLVLIIVLVLATLWKIQNQWSYRAVEHLPGILVPEEPIQTQPPINPKPIELHGAVLSPVADYEITARVLGREPYRFGKDSKYSPLDLALGWGRMSDTAVLDEMTITQDRRTYFWYSERLPVTKEYVTAHSANVHCIPANGNVEDDLMRIRPGEVVTLIGKLVNVNHPDGFSWGTSTVRTDSGDGACEVMYVERAFPRPR